MKNDTHIDCVEKVFIEASHNRDTHITESKSISSAVMAQLRRERMVTEKEDDNFWQLFAQPLATCFSFAIFAVFCSLIYFSSSTYDDTMIEVLSNNSENQIYTMWEGY